MVLNGSDSNTGVSACIYCWKSIILALSLSFQKVLVEVSACSFFRRHYTTLVFILLLCWYVFVRLCFTQYNKSSRQKVHWLSLLENKTHMRSKQHLRLLWNFANRNDKSLKEWWKISCTELIHHLSKLSICFSFGCIFPDTDKKIH